MKIKLKVLKGSTAGTELKVPTPKCIIGRSEECHLRPKSEAISRRHCAIFVKEGNVFLRDFESKNGTFVNGQRVAKDILLKTGDQLQVGPLAFEILIDHALGGDKKSKVTSIREAAARTTESVRKKTELGDADISDWLEEADELERGRRLSDPETRQLKLDETDQVTLQMTIEERIKAQPNTTPEETKKPEEEEPKKKKGPGKLPTPPPKATKDSGEAAADMLRKFFNNR
jgi:pSer/pThr/pTyr-binding forkhead associated (FHA) protein